MKDISISWLCSIYYLTDEVEFLESILSIFDQDIEIDFEIVVVLDGDIKEDLSKIINYYQEKGRIKVIRIVSNVGLGLALKEGLRHCNGDFILRFDTDDINHKSRLREQLKFMKSHPNLAASSSYVYEFNNSNKSFNKIILKKVPTGKKCKQLLGLINTINHPASIIRKKYISSDINYCNLKYFEDFYLWLIMKNSNLGLDNLSKPLVFMRRNSINERRKGFDYMQYEFIFYLKTLKDKLIPIYFIPIILIRLITRILGAPRVLIGWRKKTSLDIHPSDLYRSNSIKIKKMICGGLKE